MSAGSWESTGSGPPSGVQLAGPPWIRANAERSEGIPRLEVPLRPGTGERDEQEYWIRYVLGSGGNIQELLFDPDENERSWGARPTYGSRWGLPPQSHAEEFARALLLCRHLGLATRGALGTPGHADAIVLRSYAAAFIGGLLGFADEGGD